MRFWFGKRRKFFLSIKYVASGSNRTIATRAAIRIRKNAIIIYESKKLLASPEKNACLKAGCTDL
jgi:hypothetical protein